MCVLWGGTLSENLWKALTLKSSSREMNSTLPLNISGPTNLAYCSHWNPELVSTGPSGVESSFGELNCVHLQTHVNVGHL